MNEHVAEKFARQRKFKSDRKTSHEPGNSKEQLNRDIRAYVAATSAPLANTAKPWLLKSEVPTTEEILDDGGPVQLSENRLDRPWPNSRKYLETHYELLREDAISPLRDAVHQFRSTPDMCDDDQLAVYVKVHIAGFTFAPVGLAVRLQFSTARAGKTIAWEYSKRLVSGTLVALTPSNDNFQKTCVIAVVAARPLDNVKATPSSIDVFYPRPDEVEIDPQREWVMIEARSGYYEGLRYTLTALQKLHQERFVPVVSQQLTSLIAPHRFPLAEHICRLQTDLQAPVYLESCPTIDLSSALNKVDERHPPRKYNILENWPQAAEDVLDDSQWAALRQMLTRRLSVIQGPPGTGKTHVSVVGLRVLLENKSPADPPIIIAAHTNHALDQILRHISNFDDTYIRLGGRSKNAEVRKHTLYELRKKYNVRPPLGSFFGWATKEQNDLAKAMAKTIAPLVKEDEAHPLAPHVLRELGIITPNQAESLLHGASEWVSSSPEQPLDPMSLWLDKQLIPFQVVYEQDLFGLEEEEKDEEYEQLKELEAEHGVDDDEDMEMLQGLFRIVEDKYTCHASPSSRAGAEAQLAKHSDLWNVPERARGALYRLFQDRAKAAILVRFREQAQRYAQISQNLQIGKWERDAVLLQKANFIGMTTTGFSKYRPLVASLKPKIILVEEAAEVLEGPVTAVCVESLQHLILVGDHQQLQGHCNVKELEEVFNLNVSMFERLVRNNMPFTTLTRQRRMDPEIRRALAPIYHDQLQDHPSVIGRPPVPGMGDVRSFFFNHDWSESSDSMLSKYNEQEAEFIVGLFCYLVRGGMVPPHGITILTFYNGQRKLILNLLKKQQFLAGEYLSVNTVDSYQGEENAIVLLSLVRSNPQGKIGFLDVASRVCVALSRARLGFYIFGNATQLSGDTLWNQVIAIMAHNPNRVGTVFPIQCIKHDRKSEVKYPQEWEGRWGCNQKCGEMLVCGHKCTLTCHPFPHEVAICKANCRRSLICGHPCAMECSQQCACKCADFARLSGPAESGDTYRNNSRNPALMEVQCNNKTENDPVISARQATRSTSSTEMTPRTRGSQMAASSSSSATSDRFGRMTSNQQLASRTNWGAFANGGAKNDDLLRDKGVIQLKQRLIEQSLDLICLDDHAMEAPEWRRETIMAVKNETQKILKNGRVRHDHEYLLTTGKSQREVNFAAPGKPEISTSDGGEVGNLIDID